MSDFQQTIVLGNVGADPELRYTPTGLAVVGFSVACNKVTGKGDARTTNTTWFKCTAWRDLAETIAQHVKRGDKVQVVGTVEVSAYIKDGAARASLDLTVQSITFVESVRERKEPVTANTAEDIPF